jgi:hypothetical protein
MKRKLILLVILLLTAMIISGCDVTGIIPPISENPELTPEEIALIRKWGYGGDYVVRWPNGYVDVYDATGYSQMQEVLNQWNIVIGGPVVFRLSSNPNSPVRIIFNPDMSYCGLEDVQWGDDYVFSEVIIEVNPDEYTCETYNPNTKYCSYLVMFNAVVGFNYWTEIDPSPFEDWSNFNTIPDTIKTMVHALYKVPPGYSLIDEQEIEFEPFNCEPYPFNCYGCWQGASEFGGFNLIDYYSTPKVTLKPKVGTLPKNIKITLGGVKFDIEKPFIFSGPIDSCTTKSVTGEWSASSSTIAEATFINGVLTNKKYDDINGYVIETDFLSSQIYIKLSEDRGHAFKAVPWKGIEMKVYDLSGKEIGSYSFSKGIFPKVESNFGQCVWWAIRLKWETDGIKITSPFYPPIGFKIIDETYSPKRNDVLIAKYDDVEHYAFVKEEDIEGETVTISQFNYPKQERKSVQKLRWENGIWFVPDLGNCTYWCQFNYYIR